VDILFQHIKFRLFKNKSQDNNDIFSEWRKSLSEWRKSLSKRRKWLSKGLFFSGIVSGDKGFAITVVIWHILQPGSRGLGMTVPFWLLCFRIRQDPE
jgi:hypothetical protein